MQDGFPQPPARVISGRALLKIPTMPCEAFAATSPKLGGAGRESRLLLRDGALRMEAWAVSSVGREHARLGTVRLPPFHVSSAAHGFALHDMCNDHLSRHSIWLGSDVQVSFCKRCFALDEELTPHMPCAGDGGRHRMH